MDAIKYLTSKIEALEDMVRAQDAQNKERFAAAKEQVTLALTSADKAITKADNATEKRFEGVNEFRQTLADQAALLMPREEYRVQHQNIVDKVNDLGQRVLQIETRGLTKDETGTKNVATVVAIISVIYGIVASIGIILAFFLRH